MTDDHPAMLNVAICLAMALGAIRQAARLGVPADDLADKVIDMTVETIRILEDYP